MATTTDYLNKLIDQKNALADNLVTKGVTASHDETLETLVPKILEISSGRSGIAPIGEDGTPTGDVVVPEGVVKLSDKIFNSNSNVTSVVLPEGLSAINVSGFSGCSKLNKVTLPSTLTSISSYCFRSCQALKDINYTENTVITTLDNYAFYNCTVLSSISANKILKKVRSLGSNVFDSCYGLTEIETPFVWTDMFKNCRNLKKITILGLTSSGEFGSGALNGCISLEEVILPNNYQKLSNYLFRGCTNLSNFSIPSSVTSIGEYCFSNCSKLSNISVADDANFAILRYAFENCVSITNEIATNIIKHASSLAGYIFKGCTGLTNLTIKAAGADMFRDCKNLTYLKITSVLTNKIENSICDSCSALETCYLPEGASEIGITIFYNCTSLKTVYLPSSITKATNNSLLNNNYNIFRGCTSLEDVQVGENWNMSLYLATSDNLTVDCMIAIFNNLKDLTGETAKTLTLGSTNLAKLTDEQKAIATNKNWTLA